MELNEAAGIPNVWLPDQDFRGHEHHGAGVAPETGLRA
jgi:hypothetical protein